MEGKRQMVQYDEMGEIKKGPWKVEEDEVLINHVKKNGPRDWSSIRSKGLLRRTGKSCRLRWVNKLRPNLKTGVKFSAEEERTVIDLQAQFGNKWAKIATYLPGRTDNDVKNFWSSRQKRLARILQTSAPLSHESHKNTKDPQTPLAFQVAPSLQAPKMSSTSTEEELVANSQYCSSAYIDNKSITMVPFGNCVFPSSLIYEQSALALDYTPEKKPFAEQKPPISFPQIPQFQPDFSLLIENQDFIARLGDQNFLNGFEHSSSGSVLGTAQVPKVPSFLEPEGSCQISGTAESHDTVDIDSLIDDLPPIDIFDQIEPFPSPSEWS